MAPSIVPSTAFCPQTDRFARASALAPVDLVGSQSWAANRTSLAWRRRLYACRAAPWYSSTPRSIDAGNRGLFWYSCFSPPLRLFSGHKSASRAPAPSSRDGDQLSSLYVDHRTSIRKDEAVARRITDTRERHDPGNSLPICRIEESVGRSLSHAGMIPCRTWGITSLPLV